jgi:hypothetical protein
MSALLYGVGLIHLQTPKVKIPSKYKNKVTMSEQDDELLALINLRFDRLETEIKEIRDDQIKMNARLDAFEVRSEAYDTKLDAYQKASNQVVNLAFGLIITAVLAIIIPAVIGG